MFRGGRPIEPNKPIFSTAADQRRVEREVFRGTFGRKCQAELALKKFIRRDGKIAYALAGGLEYGVGDGGC